VYHGWNLRQLLLRFVAAIVVCVFASLPTLARVHDRLSTHDNSSSFRLSKNLERPHEKIGTIALVAAAPTLVPRADTHVGDLVDIPLPQSAQFLASPLASRAPPVR